MGNGYDSVDGKIEFKTSSFSFYTLRKVEFLSSDARPADPCGACVDQCRKNCGGNSACADACPMSAECQPACSGSTTGDGGVGSGSDAGTGFPDTSFGDTGSCTPSCPTTGFTTGAPCTACGSAQPCIGTDLRCTCEPKTPGSEMGTLTACVPTGGGADTGVTDTGSSVCATITQPVSGTGSFTTISVADGYAFYKPDNKLGSDYYSQLWLVLTNKSGACTRSVSGQSASNSNTLRIRLEAKATTTPYAFTTGTYASGTAFGVIAEGLSFSSTCSPTPADNYFNGTVEITSTAGGRYQGTFSFPAGSSPAASGSFDLPTCSVDNAYGGGDAACCK